MFLHIPIVHLLLTAIHTHLTPGFLKTHGNHPLGQYFYSTHLTIPHTLLECNHYKILWRQCNVKGTLDTPSQYNKILRLLQERDIYHLTWMTIVTLRYNFTVLSLVEYVTNQEETKHILTWRPQTKWIDVVYWKDWQ